MILKLRIENFKHPETTPNESFRVIFFKEAHFFGFRVLGFSIAVLKIRLQLKTGISPIVWFNPYQGSMNFNS